MTYKVKQKRMETGSLDNLLQIEKIQLADLPACMCVCGDLRAAKVIESCEDVVDISLERLQSI